MTVALPPSELPAGGSPAGAPPIRAYQFGLEFPAGSAEHRHSADVFHAGKAGAPAAEGHRGGEGYTPLAAKPTFVLPARRQSVTEKVGIRGHDVFLTFGFDAAGKVREIFCVGFGEGDLARMLNDACFLMSPLPTDRHRCRRRASGDGRRVSGPDRGGRRPGASRMRWGGTRGLFGPSTPKGSIMRQYWTRAIIGAGVLALSAGLAIGLIWACWRLFWWALYGGRQ